MSNDDGSGRRARRGASDMQVDYSDGDGFLVGKAAALSDWSFRKEKREFQRLCQNLAKRGLRKKQRRRRQGIQPQKYLFITKDGVTRHLSEWARLTGICAPTIFMRLRAGWDPDSALSQSPKTRRPKPFCKRGHARTLDNVRPSGNGGTCCILCIRLRLRPSDKKRTQS